MTDYQKQPAPGSKAEPPLEHTISAEKLTITYTPLSRAEWFNNPKAHIDIDHLNEDDPNNKSNNCVENLDPKTKRDHCLKTVRCAKPSLTPHTNCRPVEGRKIGHSIPGNSTKIKSIVDGKVYNNYPNGILTLRTNNTSGTPGVYWDKARNSWGSRWTDINGMQKNKRFKVNATHSSDSQKTAATAHRMQMIEQNRKDKLPAVSTPWISYDSSHHASKETGCDRRGICTAAEKNGKTQNKETGEWWEFRKSQRESDDDLPGEVWKDAPQQWFKPQFSTRGGRTVKVSNMGRILTNLSTKTYGHHLKIGYYNIGSLLVHRIVATAFLDIEGLYQSRTDKSLTREQWFSGMHVDHIDENKGNNVWSNLQILTPSEHKKKTSTQSNYKKGFARARKKQRKQVEARKVGTIEWVVFDGLTAASRETKVSNGGISMVCTGRRKTNRVISPKTRIEWEFKRYPDQPDLDGEEWRKVPQIWFKRPVTSKSGHMTVSNKGRVFSHSLKKKGEGQLRIDGYRSASCGVNPFMIHRLVAAAFLGDKLESMYQDYIMTTKNMKI